MPGWKDDADIPVAYMRRPNHDCSRSFQTPIFMLIREIYEEIYPPLMSVEQL